MPGLVKNNYLFPYSLLFFLLFSCSNNAIAIIDPIFAKLDTGTDHSYRKVAQKVIVLSSENTQEELYDIIEMHSPKTIFLSPLLSAEIPAILSRDENTVICLLSAQEPKPDKRLFSSVFYSEGAAELGARLMASYIKKAKHNNENPLCIAIFSGKASQSSAPELFSSVFESENPGASLVTERIYGGYNSKAAQNIKNSDYRAAYISAELQELDDWAANAFDKNTLLIAEYPLAKPTQNALFQYYICWDIQESLIDLDRMRQQNSGNLSQAKWKTVQTGNKKARKP